MAQKRKTVSAQTRVKLSQQAKKRHRAPKGTHLGGHFLSGLHSVGVHPAGKLPERNRDVAVDALSRAQRRIRQDPDNAARIMAAHETELITGSRPTRVDIDHAPVSVRSGAVKQVSKLSQEQNWQHGKGTYRTEKPVSVSQFLTGTKSKPASIAPSHKKEVDRLLQDPNSEFNRGLGMESRTKGRYNPGQRRRLEKYVNQLQQGKSHQEALQSLTVETRGRPGRGGATQPIARSRAQYSLEKADQERSLPARKSRYEQAGTRRPHELQFGIGIKTAESLDDLRDRFPSASDRDLIQVQQQQRQYLLEEYQKNQRWAHETRRANILGDESGDRTTPSDRVVFATTNLGEPAASVPTDSLMGQYIIRKRRNAAKAMGFSENELKGKFPQALRDMHILQASTGLEYGVSGEHGVYHRTGWRKGAKTSRGYGKPIPVGSQIMYDRVGRPVYDDSGNVRFTEGATRKFSQNTRPLGLGIFIG